MNSDSIDLRHTLFLDIDGVLTSGALAAPVSELTVLHFMPRLEEVMRDYPSLSIVISSMRRE